MIKKSELYTEERQIILNKILEILNINKENNSFFLKDLDADEKKQNQILELEVDIRKYFSCSSWACFASSDIKRKVLSIIKNIMKVMNCNMIAKRKLIKIGKIKHQETCYYFIL